MELGRNEEKHISCQYIGNEDECPKICEECAISIKTDGDMALSTGNFEEAIKQYKRALFLEPLFAEAWNNLGNAYGMNSEYHNALDAFSRAIEIDPTYGKALYGKSITQHKLGMDQDAVETANTVLRLYDSDEVREFKKSISPRSDIENKETVSVDAKSNKEEQKQVEIGAIQILNNLVGTLLEDNHLCNSEEPLPLIDEIFQDEAFTRSVFAYCRRKYAHLGLKKVYGECIITSYYGSICAVCLFSKDPSGITNEPVFDYLNNHIDIEFTDTNAERMLGTKAGEEKAEKIWSILEPYLDATMKILEAIGKPTDDFMLLAMRNSYLLGMLVGRYYTSDACKAHSMGTREDIDNALKKLADSSESFQKRVSQESAMCYSIRIPPEIMNTFSCDCCGKAFEMRVREGDEDLVVRYRKLADQFIKLGFDADVQCLCKECANRAYPSSGYPHHIVFKFRANSRKTPVVSFPSTDAYRDFDYRLTLSFLKGNDTLQKIAEETDSYLDADDYLQRINSIIGKTED